MSNNLKKIGIWIGVALVAFIILKAAYGYLSDRYACHVNWKHSSYASEYHIRSGCHVEVDGKWIPEKNFRVE